MKMYAIPCLVIVGLMLSACGGGSSTNGNINGTWAAVLTDPNNTTGPAFDFKTSFTQSSGSNLNIVSLSITTENDACFGSAGTPTGTFGLSGDFNGNVSGTFGMIIPSTNPSGNTLTLNGTVANSVISGTWTLTGTGCTGQGTFTMNKQ